MDIGKQIKRLRTEKKATQEELADYLGLSFQAVSKWENEVTMPDIGLLPQISVFFGVAIDELFRLPVESHFERIENMFYFEREINDENFKHAEKFLKDVIMSDRKNPRANSDLAYLYNHRASSLQEKAAEHAKTALIYEPNNKEHHIAIWDAYHAVCGDGYLDSHFEVIQYYKEFIDKNPKNWTAIISLIENLFAARRHSEAKPYIEKMISIKRDYLYEMYLGDIELAGGNTERALKHWDEGVDGYPEVWQAYCCRADRLRKLGFLERAIDDYIKCMDVQEAPRMTDGLISLTQIYEEQGHYHKAIKAREKQIQILKEEFNILIGEQIDKPKRDIERLSKLKEFSLE